MAEIRIEDLTTKETDGTGVFDSLMESVQVRLDREYNTGRIKGPDYAKVYLGAMEATMSQAIEFLLQKQQADKQADLTAAQILNTEQSTLLLEQQVLSAIQEVEFSKAKVIEMQQRAELTEAQVQLTKQEVINATIQAKILMGQAEKMEQEVLVEQQNVLNMEQQVLKSIAEVSMLAKQEDKIDADIAIAYQQLTAMASEIALTNARVALTEAQVISEESARAKILAEISLLAKQESKIAQDIKLSEQQEANLVKELLKIEAETALLEAKANTEIRQLDLIDEQIAKITAETGLLEEKKTTEKAQHTGISRWSKLDSGGTIEGVIGKQMALYEQQSEGFNRDAEQKLAKIMTDTWSVRKSADPSGTGVTDNELKDESIAEVIAKAKLGIGITP